MNLRVTQKGWKLPYYTLRFRSFRAIIYDTWTLHRPLNFLQSTHPFARLISHWTLSHSTRSPKWFTAGNGTRPNNIPFKEYFQFPLPSCSTPDPNPLAGMGAGRRKVAAKQADSFETSRRVYLFIRLFHSTWQVSISVGYSWGFRPARGSTCTGWKRAKLFLFAQPAGSVTGDPSFGPAIVSLIAPPINYYQ